MNRTAIADLFEEEKMEERAEWIRAFLTPKKGSNRYEETLRDYFGIKARSKRSVARFQNGFLWSLTLPYVEAPEAPDWDFDTLKELVEEEGAVTTFNWQRSKRIIQEFEVDDDLIEVWVREVSDLLFLALTRWNNPYARQELVRFHNFIAHEWFEDPGPATRLWTSLIQWFDKDPEHLGSEFVRLFLDPQLPLPLSLEELVEERRLFLRMFYGKGEPADLEELQLAVLDSRGWEKRALQALNWVRLQRSTPSLRFFRELRVGFEQEIRKGEIPINGSLANQLVTLSWPFDDQEVKLIPAEAKWIPKRRFFDTWREIQDMSFVRRIAEQGNEFAAQAIKNLK